MLDAKNYKVLAEPEQKNGLQEAKIIRYFLQSKKYKDDKMGVYEDVKQALQDIVAPQIQSLVGEIKRLEEKIDGVEKRLSEKIDDVDKRLGEKIDGVEKRLEQKIDLNKAELLAEIRRIDQRIDGIDYRLITH